MKNKPLDIVGFLKLVIEALEAAKGLSKNNLNNSKYDNLVMKKDKSGQAQ